MAMLSQLLAIVIVGSLVLGPLLWRVYQDRRIERAQVIRADTDAALRQVLGGESLVAVSVDPPALAHPGRVVLSAPSDWTWLLEPAWASVAAHVPAGYEIVVKPVASTSDVLLDENLALRRAA
jgi:hypothetical protein